MINPHGHDLDARARSLLRTLIAQYLADGEPVGSRTLSPAELTLGIAAGGVTRGIMVGLAVTPGMWLFVPVTVHNPLFILYHGVMASLMLSLLGMIGGIWSAKFDHIGAVTTFRSEEHTSELQSLMSRSYAVSCLQ